MGIDTETLGIWWYREVIVGKILAVCLVSENIVENQIYQESRAEF